MAAATGAVRESLAKEVSEIRSKVEALRKEAEEYRQERDQLNAKRRQERRVQAEAKANEDAAEY